MAVQRKKVFKYCDRLARHKVKDSMSVIRDHRLVLGFTATGHT